MPKVSILMGTFNGSSSVGRAIESILTQTYHDYELIICDDKSTDNTLSIIREYANENNQVRVICNDINSGVAVCLNKCLNIAEGELIAIMDDDDISHYNRIEIEVDFLDRNLEYAIVGSSKNYYDSNGIWGSYIVEGERSAIDVFTGKNFVHSSIMMRKVALLSVGGYTISKYTRRGQDYDLWCKMYQKGYKGYNVEEALIDYYESKQSVKRRKFKYRYAGFVKRLYWRKNLNLPYIYTVYAIKELLAGAMPKCIMLKRRKRING